MPVNGVMTIYLAGAAGGHGYFYNTKYNRKFPDNGATVSKGGAGGTVRWGENIALFIIDFINIRVI